MINEVKQALGSWDLKLQPGTPRSILDAIAPFGHVAVVPGRLDPTQYGDNLLLQARYVGVCRKRDAQDQLTLSGAGMAFWLGDEDEKGDLYENAVIAASASFADSVRMLLPASGAVVEGTLHTVPGAGIYSGVHQWQTPRTAITYVCDIFSSESQPVEWRVNGDGTLDAGPIADLYRVQTPRVVLTRRPGADLFRVGLPVKGKKSTDFEDYTTRVIVLGEGIGGSVATGHADAITVPYRDIHGNVVKMARMVSSAETVGANTDVVAQLQLNGFTNPKYSIDLSTSAYDVSGDLAVGDYLWVFDPDNGLVDLSKEIYWEGQPVNPTALRCVEMSWPVTSGFTVAYRDGFGTWYDLTDYYVPESGDTRITVGDVNRAVAGISTQPVGTRPVGDSSVPAAPAFTGFSVGTYQSAETNTTKSAIRVQWAQPLNLDGSTIVDGERYEIRYRVSVVIGYQVDWDTLGQFSWDDLGTWDALISEPVSADPQWTTVVAGWDQNVTTLTEMSPGITYELQIRAVDAATPPNRGPWSGSEFVTTTGDLIAPGTPAAPGAAPNVVAGSMVAVQLTHFLGKSSGGVFNLEQDLDHLDVHVGGSDSFYPDRTNKVGELIATAGMLQQGIPAVGTFKVDQVAGVWVKVVAVDRAGNKSSASPGSQVTAVLIDDAHISDLSVSKLTAGTISTGTIDVASTLDVGTGGLVRVREGRFQVLDDAGQAIINIENARMEVLDPAGNVKNRIGLLADGTYGIESENQNGDLASLETLAFGIQSADEPFQEQIMSHGSGPPFQELDGGPEVTAQIGSSGRCIVFVSALLTVDETAQAAYMSFRVLDSDGNTVLTPNGLRALIADNEGTVVGGDATGVAASRAVLVRFLTPGPYTFRAEYAYLGNAAGFAYAGNRNITVFPF